MEFFSDLKYDENGLIPVIIQEVASGTVLMHAYTNAEALKLTLKTGKVHFYSRSRNQLWEKGETSGNYLYALKIMTDCDCDTLLITVDSVPAACHTGNKSCFYRELVQGQLSDVKPYQSNATVLYKLLDTIKDRQQNPREGSYTNYLFDKGLDKILKKIGEEATEVVIASKNNDRDALCGEVADLLYHMMVLFAEKDLSLRDIYDVLNERSR